MKPKKGVTPPQLRGYQFKAGTGKPKAAGRKGGSASPKKGK